MKKPKQFDHMMAKLAEAMEVAPSHAGTIISDAARALNKAVKIAQAGEEWERFDLIPTGGPRTGFMGREIWSSDHVARNGRSKERVLHQTQGGALVALDVSVGRDDVGDDLLRVYVAPPCDDAQAQQAEIMEFWGWDGGAIDMAKALGWNTVVWID